MQVTIGLLNTYQLYAVFGFSFRLTHYALSWIVVGSLAIHIGVKLPIIARYWRKRDAYDDGGAVVEIEPDPDAELDVSDELQRLSGQRQSSGLTGRIFAWMDRTPAPRDPDPAALTSRRGLLVAVTAAACSVVVLTAGQSSHSRPRERVRPSQAGRGPPGAAGQSHREGGGGDRPAAAPEWTLTIVHGGTREVFSRSRLGALPSGM